MQNAPSFPPSSATAGVHTRKETYDVIWRQHVLGLNFTPNEHDQPVICQVPESSSPDVLQSPAAVGDVLVAFQLRNAAVESTTSFEHAMRVLQQGELPISLRFVSRKDDRPEPVDAAEVAKNYTFTWQPQQPLGVSLTMDPCSLHTIVTRIDPQKISPDFQKLEPLVGDVLVGVCGNGEADNAVQLDRMRFEDIIDTLRKIPRPSQLTFARLIEDQDGQEKSPPVSPSHAVPAPLAHQPMQPLKPHPRLRPIPFAARQSFRIEKKPAKPFVATPSPPSSSQAHTRTAPGATAMELSHDEKKFYKVIYAGGRVGLQLRDCSREDSEKDKRKDINKTKTKGYSVCIKEVTDARSAPGLENGSPGDLLMAIGRTDLQHLSFEQVHRELAKIHTPTELLFKKRALAGASSSGGSLVDALFLFLI